MREHPVDRVIRELLDTGRDATVQEIDEIVARIAAAPFNTGTVRVPVDERGATYQGKTLGVRADSATYHLIKRVVIERQLADGTLLDEYLETLHRAARAASARLVLYAARRDQFAATITDTDDVLRPTQLGLQLLPLLLVVYSAGYGIIKTGYLISSVNEARIPGSARWLK